MRERAKCYGCDKPVETGKFSSVIVEEPSLAFPQFANPVPYLFCDECVSKGNTMKRRGIWLLSEAAYKDGK